MGIFLGDKPVTVFFNGAAAGLPVQGVFLGPIQVFPTGTAAAILYFNGAVDDAWTTVGNWWLDAEHTEPAGRLPTSADSVVVTGARFVVDDWVRVDITASGQTVVNFTLNDPVGVDATLYGSLTVTGMATFNNVQQDGTITGNATFNDASGHNGTVTGNATFNDDSFNFGNVTGTATFNDSAFNCGGTAGTFVPATPPSC
jgi:hypothetical protein